jgi:NAD(P)-dependent dehydrogenase (short-subunit alcohol dehydrogenase family)
VISHASIVNAASTAGIEAGPTNSDYSAAKHGVVGLTRSMAKEWGHLNIRVNAVAP